MTSDRIERVVYAVETTLIGLPTFAISIPLLLLGLIFAIAEMFDGTLSGLPLLILVVGGVLGLASWFVMSGTYLLSGRRDLLGMHPGWWFGLSAGIASASVFSGLILAGRGDSRGGGYFMLLCGGPLIIPAIHLISLKLRK